ncbi:hypothetical protein A6X21_05355 [Planctopirus hydrillae]|uniref:Uncharacterized protein n=1 Tax=Planctopirus hydrillae TaxID=1841610 RepID=A0A1C3EC75_9PLAN|nr:hypothetical protein A6X21_05355 [Planctopirus hydrillae]
MRKHPSVTHLKLSGPSACEIAAIRPVHTGNHRNSTSRFEQLQPDPDQSAQYSTDIFSSYTRLTTSGCDWLEPIAED